LKLPSIPNHAAEETDKDLNSLTLQLRLAAIAALLGAMHLLPGSFSSAAHAASASDFKWDLGYESVLRAWSVDPLSRLARWSGSGPVRPIIAHLADYVGAPITAAVLLEIPDHASSQVAAVWLARTPSDATLCTWHPMYPSELCQSIAPPALDQLIQELLQSQNRRPGRSAVSPNSSAAEATAATPIGFLSVYADGDAFQRPFAATEHGAIAMLAGTVADFDGFHQSIARLLQSGAGQTGWDEASYAALRRADRRAHADQRDREAVSMETHSALARSDFVHLEKLHARYLRGEERHPGGLWKLASLYYAIENYTGLGSDEQDWAALLAVAKAWEKKFPKSVAARAFHVHVLLSRMNGYRDKKKRNPASAAARAEFVNALRDTRTVLDRFRRMALAAHDPEWHRLQIYTMPYTDISRSRYRELVATSMRLYPNYHALFFAATHYSSPDWLGAPDAMANIIDPAIGSEKNREKTTAYARAYWFLDQTTHHGKLFEESRADWPTMQAGFEDMIADYPDVWNLNAYAYFACLAHDYPVMQRQLARIGDALALRAWGVDGATTHLRCITASRDASDGADVARNGGPSPSEKLEKLHRQWMAYLHIRCVWDDYQEALRAATEAAKVDQQLARVNPTTQLWLGGALARMGRHQEAVAAFSLGVDSKPTDYIALWQRGVSFEALGRADAARRDFADAARYFATVSAVDGRTCSADERQQVEAMQKKFRQYGLPAGSPAGSASGGCQSSG
jgi:tetratricopeptide (TPR) repeat protein